MKDYEYYLKKIKNNIKENKLIILTVYITGFINYIYALTHNCLSHDGLFYGPIFKSGNWEFDLGRPLLTIIDNMRGGLVAPSIIFTIGLIFISITLIIIKNMFEIKTKVPIIILSVLLTIFPTIADNVLYIYCFDSYCLSLLLATTAAYSIIKKKYIIAILAISCSLGLYQAYISITITLVLIYFILQYLENKENIKELIKSIAIIILGMITYYVGLKIGMKILHRNFADYKGANSLGINNILNLPKNIITCYKDFFDYLFKDNIIKNNYFKRNILNFGIIIISLYTIIIRIIKEKVKKIAIILIIVFPITICIMNLIAGGTNIITLTGIGFYSLYLLIILINDKYQEKAILKNITLLLIIVLSFTLMLSDNAEQMARNDVHNNFYTKTSIVLNKVYSLKEYNEEMQWMFNGIYKYNSPLNELSLGFVSEQNETFDNFIGLGGIKTFYKRYHGIDINLVDEETYKKIIQTKEYKEMKIDTVKIINNVIVIKNSEFDYDL